MEGIIVKEVNADNDTKGLDTIPKTMLTDYEFDLSRAIKRY